MANNMTNPAGTADSRPPVSLHPAFPAIVALWFAALLGLGSMVLPVAALESFVTTTGLSAIIPGAEPPLGFTARGLIALAAAGCGALAGLALARRVAQSHRPRGGNRLTRITGSSAPRPINAHEELGGEGLLAGIGRRRALSVTDEARTSDFLAHAPVPGSADDTGSGHAPDLVNMVPEPEFEVQQSHFIKAVPQDAEPVDLLDLGEELLSADAFGDEPVTVNDYSGRFAIAEEAIEVAEMDEEEDLPHSWVFRPESRTTEARPQEFRAPEFEPENTGLTEMPLAGANVGLPQLVEQLGLSMAKRRRALASAAAATVPFAPIAVTAAPAIEPGPASAPEPDQEIAYAKPELQVARPEEAAQAMAAYFGKPAAIATLRETPLPADLPAPGEAVAAPAIAARFPAFLSLAEDDGEDGDDLTASFSLPLRAQPAFEPVDELPDTAQDTDEDGDESEDGDEGFSSLLSLNNPFAARANSFVRVEEPDEDDMPVAGPVVFPGQDDGVRPATVTPAADGPAPRLFDRPGSTPAASRNPAVEMDDALRSALAKLQRMSGAA